LAPAFLPAAFFAGALAPLFFLSATLFTSVHALYHALRMKNYLKKNCDYFGAFISFDFVAKKLQ